jgi:hypothetical protein
MKKNLEIFLILTASYSLSCSVTLGLIMPLQTILLSYPQPSNFSLLFLPHGVRILAFHFYGYKAMFYLLPSSYLFWALSNHSGTELDPLSPLLGMFLCYAGYKIVLFLASLQDRKITLKLWKFLICAGAGSSLANGIGLSLLQHDGTPLVSLMGYMVGDISGLIVCFLLLMYVFRLARLISDTNNI